MNESIWHPDMPEEYKNQIVTGDARELAKRIPDESIDLIFTDPVYDRIEDYEWLAILAARILKSDSACLMWQGQQWLENTYLALSASPLTYRWQLGWYASNNMQMVGKIGRKLAPLLWYERGHSNPWRCCREIVDSPIPSGDRPHKWAKRPDAVAHYLEKFAQVGGIIFDPFTGGGTVPAVCKQLGRNYIAFEIDPATAELARERVRNTQPPLFVMEPEQLEFLDE